MLNYSTLSFRLIRFFPEIDSAVEVRNCSRYDFSFSFLPILKILLKLTTPIRKMKEWRKNTYRIMSVCFIVLWYKGARSSRSMIIRICCHYQLRAALAPAKFATQPVVLSSMLVQHPVQRFFCNFYILANKILNKLFILSGF